MRDSSDTELLRDYRRNNSEAAFTELAQRHVNLVYSAALRHVGIAADAEEITQAVFVILARKAAGLRPDVILEAWLYETTRFTALGFLRGERRRQFREQEAYMQSTIQESGSTDPVWNQLAPLLDEAMARLGKTDRDAVMLRYFKEKNLRGVAVALNISEAAAQRRVLRAVEKLRRFFTRRGVVVAAAAITASISANSVQAAPATLAKTAASIAMAQGVGATSSTLTLIKGALKLMAWAKVKTAFAVGLGIVLLGGTGAVLVKEQFPASEPRYQNKSLSEWLKQIASNYANSSTNLADIRARDAARKEAQDAVRQIGPEAIPLLLEWAGITNPIASSDPMFAGYRLAETGFWALGPIAKPAVPALTAMLTNGDDQLRGTAVADLGLIGPGAVDALPVILDLLKNDRAPFIRMWAAGVLGQIGAEHPDKIVPPLIELLKPEYDSTLHGNAIGSLGRCGTQAKDAFPFIVPYLNDPSPGIRIAATNALRQIDREAAAAAGVQPRPRRGRM